MAPAQSELEALADWVEYRACGPCRQTGEPAHPGCETAFGITALLRSLEHFEGLRIDGTHVAGWLLEDS